jgi:hypothetical protein
MPSPFPGMDPYLEGPAVWPDFHNRLAYQISDVLNRLLPAPYYAQLEIRAEVGWLDIEMTRVMLPDVTVERHSRSDAIGGVAVLGDIRTEVTPYLDVVIENDPVEVSSVRVKDSRRDHEVITAIEIVSPTNKRAGPDRDKYLEKRKELVESSTSLIEIDLLRGGQRLAGEPQYGRLLGELSPQPDFLVAVNRAWQRGLQLRYQLFPTSVREALPVLPIPLRQGEGEISLDLQYSFRHAYDSGPYARGAVDYSQPCDPPLAATDAAWAEQRIREAVRA